jgi:hypothetical protein
MAVPAIASVGMRLRRTAEGIVLIGSNRQRVELCRAVPGLAPSRRAWVLRRLLTQPAEDVRAAALAACGRIAPEPVPSDILTAMVLDPEADGDEQAKAAAVLLSSGAGPPAPVRDYLLESCRRQAFRRSYPLLVAHVTRSRLPDMDESELQALLARSFDDSDPPYVHLRELVLDNIAAFEGFRAMFVEQISRQPSYEARKFSLDCLSAIDGGLRGLSAEDWQSEEVTGAGGDAACAFEAEWAHDIQPNYQISEWKGARCIALGEGAGGNMDWIEGYAAHTVDVGTARFSMRAPREGRYRVWARAWFRDKCGNSFRLLLGDKMLEGFSDSEDLLAQWHWLPLSYGGADAVRLTQGCHRFRLEAREDGVYIDKFLLLPAGQSPQGLDPPSAVHWDATLRHSLSFSLEAQSQCRGTTHTVVVWVRRSCPELTEGTVSLQVPVPFEVSGPSRSSIRFSTGNPLCRTSFLVRLPADATVGEGIMRAEYEDTSGERVEGRMVLGGQFDWLTTGPLDPSDRLNRALKSRSNVTDEELRAQFTPYPANGYDAYRRLDLERAYGQLRNKYIYLCCDIEVAETVDYLALLTADDTAYVYVDGRLAVSQTARGPGEGRMMVRGLRLTAGRHRLFVRLYQDPAPEPTGPDAGRHSPNHCNLKLLIRKARHEIAPGIRGLPAG